METTIIKLGGEPTSGSGLVVQSASFEEAFGEYSNAKGRGRARRKNRKLERVTNRQEVKQARKGGRQEARIGRRTTRKSLRQENRDAQQASRLGRRQTRIDARGERKMGREMGSQERENYAMEQEAYRDSLMPQEVENTNEGQGSNVPMDYGSPSGLGNYGAPSDGGNYGAPSDGGNYGAPQDTGAYEESPAPAPSYGGGGGGNYGAPQEDNYSSEPETEEGAYGDDNSYESEYIQEEDEFGDDSYFNVEGMDGKAVVSPYVKDTVLKIKNNTNAYNALAKKRKEAEAQGNHTRGIENVMNNTRTRIVELKNNLDGYCNADGNPTERKRRNKEVNLALGRRLKPRNRRNQYAGSEVPVESDLNPEFDTNRIEIPAKSSFDAYSDEGRPVIINGKEDDSIPTYGNDIYGDFEPTTIEMSSSFDGPGDKKVLLSVIVGIGVGALALYVAKKKGWI
jgi:hypothetical protein